MTVADEVRRFVLTSVPSVPYLEALLLLRAEPARRWDASAVAARLYIGEAGAGELLVAMQQAGIAAPAQGGGCTYSPASPELRAVVDALAQAYSDDLVGVTDLIHSRVDRRAQKFADAFRWRKGGS